MMLKVEKYNGRKWHIRSKEYTQWCQNWDQRCGKWH